MEQNLLRLQQKNELWIMMMDEKNKFQWSGVLLVSAGLLIVGIGLSACKKKEGVDKKEGVGPLEELGRKADEKLDKVGKKIDEQADKVEEKIEKAAKELEDGANKVKEKVADGADKGSEKLRDEPKENEPKK